MERLLKSQLPGGQFNVTPERSQIMSAIRGRGNKSTELRLRMALVRGKIAGWVLHPKGIPGNPDFYFSDPDLAIFVDGCFWHGCKRCGHIPKTNQSFWQTKISRNRSRHRKVGKLLKAQGVAVLRFWEHQLMAELQSCVLKIVRHRNVHGGGL